MYTTIEGPPMERPDVTINIGPNFVLWAGGCSRQIRRDPTQPSTHTNTGVSHLTISITFLTSSLPHTHHHCITLTITASHSPSLHHCLTHSHPATISPSPKSITCLETEFPRNKSFSQCCTFHQALPLHPSSWWFTRIHR